jgi:hypothetical protein
LTRSTKDTDCPDDGPVNRCILRRVGDGPDAAQVAALIGESPEVTVLDLASSRMLLVEGSDDAIRRLLAGCPGWMAVPMETVPLPDPRPKPRRAPATDDDSAPND